MSHRTLVSRFFAAVLLVLAISPFTAPFSPCDITGLFGDGQAHEGASSKYKLTPDTPSVDAASTWLVPDLREHGSPAPGDRGVPHASHRYLGAVLRL
jgi:hypothetical protein